MDKSALMRMSKSELIALYVAEAVHDAEIAALTGKMQGFHVDESSSKVDLSEMKGNDYGVVVKSD